MVVGAHRGTMRVFYYNSSLTPSRLLLVVIVSSKGAYDCGHCRCLVVSSSLAPSSGAVGTVGSTVWENWLPRNARTLGTCGLVPCTLWFICR